MTGDVPGLQVCCQDNLNIYIFLLNKPICFCFLFLTIVPPNTSRVFPFIKCFEWNINTPKASSARSEISDKKSQGGQVLEVMELQKGNIVSNNNKRKSDLKKTSLYVKPTCSICNIEHVGFT